MILDKLFKRCHHKNEQEINRYYKATNGSLYQTRYGDFYRSYYLAIFKVYKCADCGKISEDVVLNLEFDTYDGLKNKVYELQKMNYISHESYLLK
jgi:hypothetical protein